MSRPHSTPVTVARLRALAALAVVAVVAAACGATSTPVPSSAAPSAAATASTSPASAPPATPSEQGPPTEGPTGSPTAAPSPTAAATPVDPVALFRQIGEQTAAIRGLDWKTPVEPRLIDEAEARRILTQDLESEMPPELFAKTEALYRGLALMTGDRSLKDLYLDALGAQVLGFYRDTDQTLYVVKRSGGVGPLEEYTVSHELTHALQDQAFGLANLHLDETDQGDRSLAKRSLVEGDASLASFLWMQGNLSFADLAEIVKAATDPAPQAALDALPPIARATMTFPYETGLAFVMGLQQKGGWEAVDAAWEDPPISTEQLIHPEKYAAREEPVSIGLPTDLAERLGAGWSLALEDTFGELGLRTWLAQANEKAAADAAAAGWGADRVGLYRGPDDAWAIVLQTAWDDNAAADEFRVAAKKVAATLPHAVVVTDAEGPVVLVGSDDAVLKQVRWQVVGR
jgi:hypothetical protein